MDQRSSDRPIWQPSPERVAATNLRAFMRHAHEQYRRSGLYAANHEQDPEAVAEETPAQESEARELPPPADSSASLDPPAPYPEP